jgi:hypothetical protein
MDAEDGDGPNHWALQELNSKEPQKSKREQVVQLHDRSLRESAIDHAVVDSVSLDEPIHWKVRKDVLS